MGVTKRAGRRKANDGQGGGRGGPPRAVFESSKKKEVGLSDLTLVSKITNEAINDNLKLRFEHAEIYTYIGHVLVSVNPFKQLGIYTDQVKEKYEDKNRLEAPPHVYAVAESAYHQMQHYEDNQCVIISGESGAGKTEAAKKLMEYIVYRTGRDEARIKEQMIQAGLQAASSSQSRTIKDKVLATNPLLESFGNAKTLRNNNSSRFGKYLELQFKSSAAQRRRQNQGESRRGQGEDGSLNLLEPVGATIKNYLLEKSRVVGQTRDERNFHVFYQFAKAVQARHPRAAVYQESFGITGPETYEYLRRSQCLDVNGIDDVADFDDMVKAMDTIQISDGDRDNIFRVISTILWLGNVSFVEDDSGQTTIRDPSVTAFVAYLLEVEQDAVIKALTFRHLETGTARRQAENFDVPLNTVQATAVRDSFAKALYFNLFDWIVKKLNVSLQAQQGVSVDNSIGILDIYGFEIFERNSFEQLCINYVNEKLQQIFIQLTLKTEQEEYAREQIQWTPIKYFDNKVVCDLIEERRPPGIFSALNDACATAHADSSAADGTFVQRLNGLTNQHFQPRQGQFVIKHYAGDVHYAIDGMTDKNKDQVLKDLLNLVKGEGSHGGSQNRLVQQLFPEQVNQDDRRRPPTAGDKIKVSANDLVTTLMKCSPSYIRTIKPNENKSPTEYNTGNVLHQVKYLGLQENVRIRRAGFAYRQTFDKFFDRFFPLAPTISAGVDIKPEWLAAHGNEIDDLDGTKTILKETRIAQDQYQVGTTKVFIKNPETIFALEEKRDQHYAHLVSRIQRRWRKYKGDRVSEGQQLRNEGNAILQQRKERRRFSMLGYRRFMGDYLGLNTKSGYGELVRSAINLSGHEKVVFSAKADLLVTKFGRSSKPEGRTLVMTTKSVYILVVAAIEQQASLQVEREIPLGAINFISTSSLKDDWFSIGVGSQREADPLLNCIFKTEFFTQLKLAKPGGQLDLRIGEGIVYNKKPGKLATVKAVKDPAVQRDDFYKSGAIHTSQGLPANSVSNETPKSKSDLQPKKSQPIPLRTAASQRPAVSEPSRAQAGRASAVAQSNSFAAQQTTAVASPPNPRIPQTNGFTPKQVQRVSVPPPPPPVAPVAPVVAAGPKKDYLKALYDFDGANAGNFKITKDEVFESLKEEQNGWSHVKREKGGEEGWAPISYLEKYTPPTPPPPTVVVRPPPPPAPSLPTRTNLIPTPPIQANGSRGTTPSPEPGAKGRAPPPLPSKRPAVRGKKPAPPPAPRDSAVSLGTSASGSGRATPESSDGGKAHSDAASSLADMIRARQMKMQPSSKNDDDWD